MYFGTRISVSYIFNEMYKTPIVEDDDVCNSSGEILAQKYRFQKGLKKVRVEREVHYGKWVSQ